MAPPARGRGTGTGDSAGDPGVLAAGDSALPEGLGVPSAALASGDGRKPSGFVTRSCGRELAPLEFAHEAGNRGKAGTAGAGGGGAAGLGGLLSEPPKKIPAGLGGLLSEPPQKSHLLSRGSSPNPPKKSHLGSGSSCPNTPQKSHLLSGGSSPRPTGSRWGRCDGPGGHGTLRAAGPRLAARSHHGLLLQLGLRRGLDREHRHLRALQLPHRARRQAPEADPQRLRGSRPPGVLRALVTSLLPHAREAGGGPVQLRAHARRGPGAAQGGEAASAGRGRRVVEGAVAHHGPGGADPPQLRGFGEQPGARAVVLQEHQPQGRRAAAPGLGKHPRLLPHPGERDLQRLVLAVRAGPGREPGGDGEALQDPEPGQRRLLHLPPSALRQPQGAGAALHTQLRRALLPPGQAVPDAEAAEAVVAGRVGGAAGVAEAGGEAGSGAVRRGLDGLLQRAHQGGSEEPEGWQHVPQRLPGRGQPDEEAAAPAAGAALRRGHQGAHLHHHRVHGEGQPRGFPQDVGRGQAQHQQTAGHGSADCRRHGLHRGQELHPQGPEGRQHPRLGHAVLQNRRFRAGAAHRGQRVHGSGGGEIPH